MARWIRALDAARLDPVAMEKARVCLLDLIGVAAQAHDLPWSRQAAAFANATMAHGLVQEDMHTPSVSHIGVVVWPTLLALAEHERVTGRELIAAGIVGYQAMGRLGQALITKERIGKSIHPWPRGAARFAHSPAPRSRFDGAQCGLCRPASRYW